MILSIAFGLGPLVVLALVTVAAMRRANTRSSTFPVVVGAVTGGLAAWWAFSMPTFADDTWLELIVPAILIALAVVMAGSATGGLVAACAAAAVFCLVFIAWNVSTGLGTGIESTALVLFWAFMLVPGLVVGLLARRLLS